MTLRVDFYVVAGTGPGVRSHLACRLAERAWSAGHRVFVLAGSPLDAERLDELMWTYRQDSFLPHALMPPSGASDTDELADTPVWIGAGQVPDAMDDVLINLSDDVPLGYRQFTRIGEVIDGTDASRAAGRQRFRYYREHDCDVHTHNL